MAATTRFNAGEIWRATGRADDGDDVRVAILAVEHHDALGEICSVAVTGVCIRNPSMDGGVQTDLPHAPIAADALARSVTELIARNGPSSQDEDFCEAYRQWHEPFTRGEAGIFTLPVTEILDLVESAINTRPAC
ncbi:MAG: hypothetical protein ACK5JT_21835 [Hyphomicrobiaceae bacterium]